MTFTLTLAMITLFGLLAIGTPVGFAMAGSGVLGLWMVGGMPMLTGILQTAPLSAVTSYELITIPMFLLMAEFVLVSGIADDLFKRKLVKHVGAFSRKRVTVQILDEIGVQMERFILVQIFTSAIVAVT